MISSPFFKRQMHIHHAPGRNRAPRQGPSSTAAPLLAIKLIEIFECKLLGFSFASVHGIEQFPARPLHVLP
jgi:hypothetical protein